MPPNMADWLPQDHLVWFVIDVVDQLDTARLHATRRRGGTGRQGYDPDMLLGLLLYSYAIGERSSRRIEQLCTDHVAFRVLCGQDPPDHSTIARFRAEHQEVFADLFAQMLRLCAAAGMVKVGIVSIDGTKIAANAARGANRTPDWIREEAQRIAAQVVAEAAATDAVEDHAVEGNGDDDSTGGLPPGLATRSGRAANLAKALAELDRQDAEHAMVDAGDESRIVNLLARLEAGEHVRGAMPAGVDPVRWHEAGLAGCQRILAELHGVRGSEASRRRRDTRVRVKRLTAALARAQAAPTPPDLRGAAARRRDRLHAAARARGGTGPTVNTTDPDSRLMTHGSGGGSVQGYNAQLAVTDDHLILGVHLSQDANDLHTFLPTLAAAATSATSLDLSIRTVLADAGYFTTENCSTGTEGPDRLIAPGKNHAVALAAMKDPTTGPPPEDLDALESMRHRLRDPVNAAIYKRRSATVETVIAHLKDQAGLRTFARRGLQAAAAELHLAATALNLTKLHKAALSTN